tara:strand:- start:486 stop:974 length:489 start_codon:yes stop_codon:yes gene_type:complete
MLEKKRITDLSGNEHSYEEFVKSIRKHDQEGFDTYIGTDSQINGGKIDIATCVIFVRRDSPFGRDCSGKVFCFKERIPRKDYPNLRMRMMLEAYRSLETAMFLEKYINNTIHIHLDIGPSSRFNKTSAYKVELTGMVRSQGYECEIKPNAWAASGVADRACR